MPWPVGGLRRGGSYPTCNRNTGSLPTPCPLPPPSFDPCQPVYTTEDLGIAVGLLAASVVAATLVQVALVVILRTFIALPEHVPL